MTKPTPTFYVLHGDDVFAIEEQVAKMRASMGDPATADLNMAAFDARAATIADVFNSVSAFPFLADKRLTIVSGWLSALTRNAGGRADLKKIAEQLPDLPDWARLVFAERQPLKKTNPVVKAAEADPNGFVKQFTMPKNASRWITQRVEKHYNAAIDAAAVRALAAVVSDDLVRADNELFKLVAYVGMERPIGEEDVAALTPYVPEQSVFDMVDALGRRDGRSAARLLRQLLADSEPLSLFAMIIRQFRILLQAKDHLTNGKGRGRSLAKALGLHPFVGEKAEKQSRNFSLEDLEAIHHHLLDIDRQIKTGKIDPVLALDTLVARLTK